MIQFVFLLPLFQTKNYWFNSWLMCCNEQIHFCRSTQRLASPSSGTSTTAATMNTVIIPASHGISTTPRWQNKRPQAPETGAALWSTCQETKVGLRIEFPGFLMETHLVLCNYLSLSLSLFVVESAYLHTHARNRVHVHLCCYCPYWSFWGLSIRSNLKEGWATWP